MQELSVDGKVHCKSNLRVQEDAFIDGSLSVGGSVLKIWTLCGCSRPKAC